MNLITLCIAIWGAITGTLGLVLKALDFRKSKPALKIELADSKHSFVADQNLIKWDGSECVGDWNAAIISLSIKNIGKQPTTISQIKSGFFRNEVKRFIWKDIRTGNNRLVTYSKSVDRDSTRYLSPKYSQASLLPLRVDPYDSQEIRLCIPFIPRDLLSNEKQKIQLKIISTDKTYKFNVLVPEIHRLFSDLETYTRQQ